MLAQEARAPSRRISYLAVTSLELELGHLACRHGAAARQPRWLARPGGSMLEREIVN